MRILLTGGTGFIGSAVARGVDSWTDHELILAGRRAGAVILGVRYIEIGDIGAITDWAPALQQVDVVIHCAARVHVLAESERDPLAAFRVVNVTGTLRLARQAAEQGVRRFVFLSSVKVHGETSAPGRPFRVGDSYAPADAYAISKMEAEQALLALAEETSMEVVIIRPPLVYGPGVGANFRSMMDWLSRGVPLPLGAVHNRRSLLALDNLVDLVLLCVEHPAAAGRVLLASDDEDLSTPELLRRLGRAMGRSARLLPIPPRCLELGATLLGRPALSQRLCGFLQVDISETRELLGWTPPLTVEEALRRTAEAYQAAQ
ncbi:UDP-glucose 4-epimerase family protein [Zestomonas carbonaria]|uniref:N-acetyl-alpha-D-glucosaminyl-diphospho-ditrans, octacis-undecaprenol 4-epimerase n=1 Tax=Zestomonas carbonaria TaxID=2762745 RepID=A0A7U7IC32_9GAMM|nr:SDR family oxidoreductase [Pseudomonas carbonaria]CAD5109722.1 N-acetyl-alpha-D-glucosaminyl-diphospho-ditrans, octacis-undecaprenol 4-epimerase [Pseudomonas carbonaria]